MATIKKKKKKDKYWQDVYKEEPFHDPQGYKMVVTMETAWRFLQILKNRTIVYFHKLTSEWNKRMEIRNLKKYLHSHVRCSIIHCNMSHSKCPVDDWVKKMWYIHTVKCYSA